MKSILYLGLDPSRFGQVVTHYPIIEIKPRPPDELKPHFAQLPHFDTVIFTSRSSIPIYIHYAKVQRPCIVVGKATEELALQSGLKVKCCAELEQGEGVLEILKKDKGSYFFPHSSRARPLLIDYLKNREAHTFPLYDTVATERKIDLDPFDTLVFTSPSTVEAFRELYGDIPEGKEVIAIGPITQSFL